VLDHSIDARGNGSIRAARAAGRRYAVAFGCTLLAILVWARFGELILPSPFPLLLAAVAFSASYGGLGPGLAAIAVAGLAIGSSYASFPQGLRILGEPNMAVQLVVFLAIALLISSLTWRMRSAQRRTEGALRTRDEFLAVASHELRSPLSLLRVQAGLLRDQLESGELVRSAEADTVVARIERQADKLNRLVAQLLDLSQIQSGKFVLRPEPTDLTLLTTDIVRDLQVAGYLVDLRASEAAPLHADPLRLEQVVRNLLDNALKHSPADVPIEVDVKLCAGRSVRLAVRDHGAGVSPAHRQAIFNRFYQAPGHRADGLGLGLFVCRHIVELHGGSIGIQAPAAGGTCFTVILPARTQVLESAQQPR